VRGRYGNITRIGACCHLWASEVLRMATSQICNLTESTSTAERRGVRMYPRGVDVHYSLGSVERCARIRNISPTGIYLCTADRWALGATVLLTMKDGGIGQEHRESSVCIPARVVRYDDEGVGMEFELEGISTDEWLSLFSRAISLISQNDLVRVFRAAKAFAFLHRLSPFPEAQTLGTITNAMSQERAERAINIALTAETLLVSKKAKLRLDVSPPLIRQILEEGSRSNDGQILRYWSGILASTCLDCPDRRASAGFVTLLSGLAPIHIRILDAAGARGIQAERESGFKFPENYHCTMEEVAEITGVQDPAEIDSAVDYLDGLGLLEMTVKHSGHKQFNLTPTLLGLKFYARCTAQTG
jgi:hypothetical protein